VGLLPDSPAATRVRVGLAGDEGSEGVETFFFFLQNFDFAGVGEVSGGPVDDAGPAGKEELEAGDDAEGEP